MQVLSACGGLEVLDVLADVGHVVAVVVERNPLQPEINDVSKWSPVIGGWPAVLGTVSERPWNMEPLDEWSRRLLASDNTASPAEKGKRGAPTTCIHRETCQGSADPGSAFFQSSGGT